MEIIEKKYQCFYCSGSYPTNEIVTYHGYGQAVCGWCLKSRMFNDLAIQSILRIYGLRYGQYDSELLDIETTRATIRYVIRTNDTSFIKQKPCKMITKVTNSTELREALNENLNALLTKKRKLLVVKEVNNTLGKILMDVKMELMQNALTSNRETISWFSPDNSGVRIRSVKAKEVKELV